MKTLAGSIASLTPISTDAAQAFALISTTHLAAWGDDSGNSLLTEGAEFARKQ